MDCSSGADIGDHYRFFWLHMVDEKDLWGRG